jgi:alkyl hydroperoxide reductase subunit AhpC
MVALVQRPAPDFKATAVIEGEFQDISLSDYSGQWYGTLSFNVFFCSNGRVSS